MEGIHVEAEDLIDVLIEDTRGTTEMPYRYPSGRRSATTSGNRGFPVSGKYPKTYQREQTAIRRHEFQQGGANQANGTTLLANEWIGFDICRFKRTFGGATPDVPPTPTASNNYQTADVMNGSAIRNLRAKITMKNKSTASDFTLDVYMVAMSFYDALTTQVVYAGIIPSSMETIAPDQGEVNWATPSGTNLTPNSIHNYKGVQRIYKHLGSIELSQETGKNPIVELNINSIPEKCRRSNLGMYFGIILVNSSAKNGAAGMAYDAAMDVSFDEIPAAERLPWLI